MNIRLADLKLWHLLTTLIVAGIVTGATFWVIHEVHVSQAAGRAADCVVGYAPHTLGYQLCLDGKLKP